MIYTYRRVSTDEQHNGPEAQLSTIAGWISRQPTGPDFVPGTATHFLDVGVSGSVPFLERPAGVHLGIRIEQDKEPPTIVVAKLDRLFRSVADAATTLDHWCKVGVKLVSVTEGFDMTSPYGKAMAHIMSALAELERDMIRERTKAALGAKRARGEVLGQVPYGFDCVDGKLVANIKEHEVIAGIVRWHELGNSQRWIADWMNKWGHPCKRGGKWRQSMISEILRRHLTQPNVVVESKNGTTPPQVPSTSETTNDDGFTCNTA